MNSMDQMETEVVFGSKESFFEGHFPGRPVTPGVMLIDMAVSAARNMLGRNIVPKSIRKVKFSNPVLPDEMVKLKMDRRGEGEVGYLFSKDGAPCASGVLFF
jgi:3-hydroxymyristoyl/3-hydroxydecanoyl-(acyl carrier protein) dehydratase